MENQHRKITGYRELTQDEIDLMNEIKAHGAASQGLINKVTALESNGFIADANHSISEPMRWIAIAKTDFQTGLMALTRAVAKPQSF